MLCNFHLLFLSAFSMKGCVHYTLERPIQNGCGTKTILNAPNWAIETNKKTILNARNWAWL